jgi:hypothetical protein
LSDSRVKEIAHKFIKKLNIMQKNQLFFGKITHLRGAVASIMDRKIKESIIDAGVIFGRIIDNIHVEGPGGICMVNVDYDGKVVGLNNLMRPVKSTIGSVKIRPTETAIEEIESHFQRFKGDITVAKARFSYLELGTYDVQRTLQPAYSFIYNIEYNGVDKKYITVYPAGSEVYEPLELGRRFLYKKFNRKK